MHHIPLSATHSPSSTYFGKTTIVLKLPFKSEDLTNGWHNIKGLIVGFPVAGVLFGVQPAVGWGRLPCPLLPVDPGIDGGFLSLLRL